MPRGQTVTDDEIIEVFRSSPDPALTVGEVADAIGMTDEGARGRMARLVESGRLQWKKPGARTAVYWLNDSDSE